MNLVKNVALVLSGGLIVGSILLSKIGLTRSVLSRRGSAILSGVGVGLGCAIFIYYGVSSGDLIGSIFVGIVAAVVSGFILFIYRK
jgi:hypothetical protein